MTKNSLRKSSSQSRMTRSPSYRGLSSSSLLASELKSRTRAMNTTPEMMLRTALHSLGGRYRLHARDLPGKPDIIFRRARIAVFVDGDFWHGRYWRRQRQKLLKGANPSYWVAKIRSNRARDRMHSKLLQDRGWTVLRFWESDIKDSPIAVALEVLENVSARFNSRQ